MSFRNAFLAALLLAACVTAASAEERDTQEQAIRVSAADKAACMPDALRYCRDAMPNVQDVLVCFGRHREKISTGCRSRLASYGLQ